MICFLTYSLTVTTKTVLYNIYCAARQLEPLTKQRRLRRNSEDVLRN